MQIKLFYLACCLLFSLPALAQPAMQKEFRNFYTSMDSIHANTSSGTCKTNITIYETALSELKLNSLAKTLETFYAVNTPLKNKSGNNCLAFYSLVRYVDSLIRVSAENISSPADSIVLLNAFGYLRNKIWGYQAVDVHFTGKDGNTVSPSLTILSQPPSMLNKKQQEADGFEWYVLPGSVYELSADARGYKPYRVRLENIKKDTSLLISLESINDDPVTGVTTSTDNDKNKSTVNPYAWLSLALAILLLALLARQVFRRSPNRNASITTPSTEEPILTVMTNKIPRRVVATDEPAISKPYFLSEIMMTAGPRKKPVNDNNPDRDLGEDVCGFVMHDDEVVMWVLDGASDYYSETNPDTGREYFSSRLLAQSIAGKLKQQFAAINPASFEEIVTGIISAVKADWTKAITALPEEEIQVLKTNIRDGKHPECAATILITKFSLSGELLVYRSGDCKLFIYRRQPGMLKYVPSFLSAKNNKSNDWLFFRMIETTGGTLDIVHNKPLFEVVSENNIASIIAVSDGIGAETIASLSMDQPGDKDELRLKIIEQVQGTGDDKSLCIIEIKEA